MSNVDKETSWLEVGYNMYLFFGGISVRVEVGPLYGRMVTS